MNKTILIAAAAAILSSTTALTSAAHAGGGIRVGFGFPLGSFVARPSHGSFAGSSGGCHKKAPSYASHKPERRTEPRVASKPHYEPRVASAPHRDPAPTVRRVHTETKVASYSNSTPKKPRSVYRAEQEDTSSNDTTEDLENGPTGSSALIEGDSKASAADVTTVEVPADDDAPVAETPATEGDAVATIEETPAETPAPAAIETPAETPEVAEEPTSKKSKDAKDCTKYIPSIGVTVKVGC